MLTKLRYKWVRKAHFLMGKLHASAQSSFTEEQRAKWRMRGQIPWTTGYLEERTWFVEQQFASGERMAGFAAAELGFLPPGYGKGMDERCVEWPWAMANIGSVARVLDAGSALNHPHILSLPIWRDKKLDIFTLAPEPICEWQRGVSYLFGDLRHMPYRNEEFDA